MKRHLLRAVVVLAMFIALSAHCDKTPPPTQTKKAVKKKAAETKKPTAKPVAKTVSKPKAVPKKKKDGFDERMAALEQRVDDILWRCDLMSYSPFSDHILFPYE